MARKKRYLSKGWKSKYEIEFYDPFKYAMINQPQIIPGMVVEAIYEKANPRPGTKRGGKYLLFILNVDSVSTRESGLISVHCLDLDVIRPHMFIQVLKKIGGGAGAYKKNIKTVKIRGNDFRIYEMTQNPKTLYTGTIKMLVKTIIPGSYKTFEYYHGFRRFKLWDFDFSKEDEMGAAEDDKIISGITEIKAIHNSGLTIYGEAAREAIIAGTAVEVKK